MKLTLQGAAKVGAGHFGKEVSSLLLLEPPQNKGGRLSLDVILVTFYYFYIPLKLLLK